MQRTAFPFQEKPTALRQAKRSLDKQNDYTLVLIILISKTMILRILQPSDFMTSQVIETQHAISLFLHHYMQIMYHSSSIY